MPLPTDQPEDPAEARTLGRYRLRYRVASGGMAAVYLAQLATDAGFTKWVAIKIIHAHIAEDPRFVEMFLDEARLAAKLDHPHICTIFDFGRADGTYYLAMEYLHGESLERLGRRKAKSGGLDPRIGARIVCDAARGLHHAHELKMDDGQPADVVHRDVSPQNIFVLYSGVTKVVDFGIARSAERIADKTKTGELKGKLAYMSPEQLAAPDEVDRRTDVWALGVVLWEVTLGKRLFRRSNPGATVAAIGQPIPPPTSISPSYPPALERIVLKALMREPSDRYPTAAELARDLERFLASTGEPCSAEDVAAYVSDTFADEKLAREQLLTQDATEVSAVPTLGEPSETEMPMLDPVRLSAPPVPPAALSATRASASVPPPPSAPVARRGWVPWATGAVAVVASVAVGSIVTTQLAGRPIAATPMSEPPSVGTWEVVPRGDQGAAEGPSEAQENGNAAQPERQREPGDPAEPGTPPEPGVHPETAVSPETGAQVAQGALDTRDAPAPENTEPVDAPTPAKRAPERARDPAARAAPRTRRATDTSGDPRSALVGEFGMVALSTSPPGLQVYRGSQLLGRTPLQTRLPVGVHRLRVVDSSGDPHTVDVAIEAFATSVLSVTVD